MFGMTTTNPTDDEIFEVLLLGAHSREQMADRIRDLFGAPAMPTDRYPLIQEVLDQFGYEHLPAHLQPLSKPFHDLAAGLVLDIPDSRLLGLALEKLVEAKDWAVRAGRPVVEANAAADAAQEQRKSSIVEKQARFDRVSPENPMGVELPDDRPMADIPRDAGLHG